MTTRPLAELTALCYSHITHAEAHLQQAEWLLERDAPDTPDHSLHLGVLRHMLQDLLPQRCSRGHQQGLKPIQLPMSQHVTSQYITSQHRPAMCCAAY